MASKPHTPHDALLTDAASRLRAAGVDNPRLDAELLLARALGVTRLDVMTGSDAARSRAAPAALRRFRALIDRRARRVPLQHLTGETEFYGRPFHVTPDVLVPRPETETLVREAVARLHALRNERVPRPPKRSRRRLPDTIRVLDVGTGSGNIAVTVACECPAAAVVATDVSRAALVVARRNAQRHGVADRIRFAAGDLFVPVRMRGGSPDPPGYKHPAPSSSSLFHLILSNPPYISAADLSACMPEVRDHEPRIATCAGPDGLAVIRRLLREAPDVLAPGGALLIEIGAGQAAAALRLAAFTGRYAAARAVKDAAGIERVVVLERGRL